MKNPLTDFIVNGVERPSEAILKCVDRYMDGGCERDELERTVRLNVAQSGLEGLASADPIAALIERDK